MAYATVADVQAYLDQMGGATLTLGIGSTPTTTTVSGWLDQLSATIDALLTGLGYTTIPATGASDVLMLKRFVSQKAAAMSFYAGFMVDDAPAKVLKWDEEWDWLIASLKDKSMRLVDQNPRTRTGVVYSQRYTGY